MVEIAIAEVPQCKIPSAAMAVRASQAEVVSKHGAQSSITWRSKCIEALRRRFTCSPQPGTIASYASALNPITRPMSLISFLFELSHFRVCQTMDARRKESRMSHTAKVRLKKERMQVTRRASRSDIWDLSGFRRSGEFAP